MFGASFMFGSLSKFTVSFHSADCVSRYTGTCSRKTIKEWFLRKRRAFSKIKPKLPSISVRERGDRLMIPSLQKSHRHFGTSQTAIGWNILSSGVIP
ncbi:hypothetical protein CEXT_793201 [Caerostris extrusa]|uniref:Uncharacterized protein n=1 Tax=Caerostris extrusa TaxID=172846 RepID=A0AAV4V5P9_CAEEX|nr:hypothetical protein CEXT_793201 [Caerostris extrusa]